MRLPISLSLCDHGPMLHRFCRFITAELRTSALSNNFEAALFLFLGEICCRHCSHLHRFPINKQRFDNVSVDVGHVSIAHMEKRRLPRLKFWLQSRRIPRRRFPIEGECFNDGNNTTYGRFGFCACAETGKLLLPVRNPLSTRISIVL